MADKHGNAFLLLVLGIVVFSAQCYGAALPKPSSDDGASSQTGRHFTWLTMQARKIPSSGIESLKIRFQGRTRLSVVLPKFSWGAAIRKMPESRVSVQDWVKNIEASLLQDKEYCRDDLSNAAD